MTDQTKIPLPSQETSPRQASRLSSLERAAGGIDLNRYIAAPIPLDDLPPAPVRREVRKAPEPQQADEPVAVARRPVRDSANAPVSEPAAEAPPVARASEPVAVREAAPAPTPAPEAGPAVETEIEPVSFRGKKHRVDRARLRDQGLIVPEGVVTALLEEFRIAKRKLLVNAADLRRGSSGGAAQRVLISSPHSGEGKTYCAINLALAIAAEKESEVLLVDSDFAKPSILSILGLPGGPGLMDALVDPAIDVAELVIGTDIPGLWVLPAGNTTNSDTEYLNSSRTAKVLDRLTQGAPQRIVLFDSPPALAASPAAALAKYVGQALVVVRADRTGQGALEDAVSLLSACPNIELLLNAVHFSPSGRKFGSYHGYGG